MEKQLARVGDFNLAYLVGSADAAGSPALVSHLLKIGLRGEAAPLADVDAILVGVTEEAIADKVSASVSD